MQYPQSALMVAAVWAKNLAFLGVAETTFGTTGGVSHGEITRTAATMLLE
jgi:hypothetical protein